MKSNALDPHRFTVEKGASEWKECIRMFETKLNPPRLEAGFKAMSPAMIAKQLKKAGVSSPQDAYELHRKCQDFQSFSKGFWFFVKGSDRR